MKKKVMASVFAALMAPALAHATDFMGIELGAKFDMPECQFTGEGYLARYTFVFDQPVRPCWKRSILKGKPGEALDKDSSFKIDFVTSDGKTPLGVGADSTLIVIDGVVEGVQATTNGYEHQDSILRALQTKFGKPTSLKEEAMENRMGASFRSHEAVWKTPALEVKFSGMVSRIDFGYISVFTPKATAFVEEEYERKQKAAPSF